MPFLIDGHNLIPHLAGLSLDDPEDERLLVERLRHFAAWSRRRITVYFDRRAPGAGRGLTGGTVTVHFVAHPSTADDAIRRHLERLRGEARNWTVVSSDTEVRRAADHAGARWLSAQAFARLLGAGRRVEAEEEKPEIPANSKELAEWESLFLRKKQPPSRRRP